MSIELRKKITTLAIALGLSLAPLAVPAIAYGQGSSIEDNLKCGSNLTFDTSTGTCKDISAGPDRINSIITTVINIFSVIVGIIAVIMIIFGGFKYVTSGGDSGNITSAKNTIIYAIVGLVIVALAQFLVQFVLDKATQ